MFIVPVLGTCLHQCTLQHIRKHELINGTTQSVPSLGLGGLLHLVEVL